MAKNKVFSLLREASIVLTKLRRDFPCPWCGEAAGYVGGRCPPDCRFQELRKELEPFDPPAKGFP